MSQVEISEAGARLRALVERVQTGDEIVLVDDGRAVARLVAPMPTSERRAPRVLGRLEGQFQVPEDFDAPLPDDVIALFYDGPIFPDEQPSVDKRKAKGTKPSRKR